MSKMKKSKSLRPPIPIVTPNSTLSNTDNDSQFELELCWCVQELEIALNSGELSQKAVEDTVKNLKILKGSSAPLIKKRQVMKAAMGDYRAKMKDEEKKMSLAPKQIKFNTVSETNQKSSFVKKSAILSSGKEFKFNFSAPEEERPTKEEDTQQQPKTKEASNFNNKNLQLTSDSGFKFNFSINEVDNEIRFDKLSIKN